MKLELKHLAPYLESGLIVHCKNGKTWQGHDNITAKELDSKALEMWGIDNITPILRSLRTLSKDNDKELLKFEYFDTEGYYNCYLKDRLSLFENGELFKLDGMYYKPTEMPYDFVNYLISVHYDVFGLIDKGLAIDINTVK